MTDFAVVLLYDEACGFTAIVPDLQSVNVRGQTFVEVMEKARQAIADNLEDLNAEERRKLPKKRFVAVQKVKV